MTIHSLLAQACLLLAAVASSHAVCVPGPGTTTPLSCDNHMVARCNVLNCEYVDCAAGGFRALMNVAASAASPGAAVGEIGGCIDGCRRKPIDMPASCEQFVSDSTCPTWAGCLVASTGREPATPLPAQAPVETIMTPTSAPTSAFVQGKVPVAAPVVAPVAAAAPAPSAGVDDFSLPVPAAVSVSPAKGTSLPVRQRQTQYR